MAARRKEPNSELLRTAKEAKKAGMSYGKYQAEKYLREQAEMKQKMKENEAAKLEKQAACIQRACEECGISGKILWYSNDRKPGTPAAKIAWDISRKKSFPTKTSFMFCDELDMCFFYSSDGTARVSYSGTAKAGSEDIKYNLISAFQKADEILDLMEEYAGQEIGKEPTP